MANLLYQIYNLGRANLIDDSLQFQNDNQNLQNECVLFCIRRWLDSTSHVSVDGLDFNMLVAYESDSRPCSCVVL